MPIKLHIMLYIAITCCTPASFLRMLGLAWQLCCGSRQVPQLGSKHLIIALNRRLDQACSGCKIPCSSICTLLLRRNQLLLHRAEFQSSGSLLSCTAAECVDRSLTPVIPHKSPEHADRLGMSTSQAERFSCLLQSFFEATITSDS